MKVKRIRFDWTHGSAMGAANAGATRDAARKRVEWRMMMIKWKVAERKVWNGGEEEAKERRKGKKR
jgi:hypothetical protein